MSKADDLRKKLELANDAFRESEPPVVWHKCEKCPGYWFDAGGEPRHPVWARLMLVLWRLGKTVRQMRKAVGG